MLVSIVREYFLIFFNYKKDVIKDDYGNFIIIIWLYLRNCKIFINIIFKLINIYIGFYWNSIVLKCI